MGINTKIKQDLWKPDIIIGIANGGSIPSALFSKIMNIPCKIVTVQLRDGSIKETLNVEEIYDTYGKNILIVDEINDTGETLNWILKNWNLPPTIKIATDFHIELMTNTLGITDKSSIVRTGQPHYKLIESIYSDTKRDLILFPHRISEEKQPEIFRDLVKSLPQYEFIFCQEVTTCKADYHKLLSAAKMVFSANLQETLGISAMEGILADAIPLLPDRLSYSEMYDDGFLYPSDWTESFDSYTAHKDILISHIIFTMESYDLYFDELQKQKIDLIKDYLTSKTMFDIICDK